MKNKINKRLPDGIRYISKGEAEFPEKCVPLLEICYRELGDFRQAYYYACRARE